MARATIKQRYGFYLDDCSLPKHVPIVCKFNTERYCSVEIGNQCFSFIQALASGPLTQSSLMPKGG